MDNPSENLSQELIVLKSIYPEVSVTPTEISLRIDITPERPVELLLKPYIGDDEKVVRRTTSKFVDGIKFFSKLPVNTNTYKITSSWINRRTMHNIINDISEIIREAVENDMMDTVLYSICNYMLNEVSVKYLDDICENYSISTSKDSDFLKLERMFAKARLYNFRQNRFECSICLNVQDGAEEGILLDCEHSFCKKCFKEYAEVIINDDDVSKLQCPNCPPKNYQKLDQMNRNELKEFLFTRIFPRRILSQVISQELIIKYENLLNNQSFEKYKQFYPFSATECPRCNNWVFRDDLDDKLTRCFKCFFNFCFDCNHSWHGTVNYCGRKLNNVPLHVIEELTSENPNSVLRQKYEQMYGKHNIKLSIESHLSDLMFEEAIANDESLVKCPHCTTVITKSDGCNKMKCFVCSKNFCYLCETLLSSDHPYEHFTDLASKCYNKLFQGMPGMEDMQNNVQFM
ncbi:hypothetical protein WICMUC_000581 [Wickerhamomyces mucosus]|uniref:RBR-type E3 ubiquitin transferase n=1 Tax=Wickerhamomyces mucosus TaxID=1378264 RepID=A0A9P8PWY3_9ASCO|nr:hypothetical protein WICMUC_000581 [Wickerhamomyces mucosus]